MWWSLCGHGCFPAEENPSSADEQSSSNIASASVGPRKGPLGPAAAAGCFIEHEESTFPTAAASLHLLLLSDVGASLGPIYARSASAGLSDVKLQQLASGIALGHVLGTGCGVKVFKAGWRGRTVAVKLTVSSGPEHLHLSAREALLSRRLSHPHLLRTYAVFLAQLSEQDLLPPPLPEAAPAPKHTHAAAAAAAAAPPASPPQTEAADTPLTCGNGAADSACHGSSSKRNSSSRGGCGANDCSIPTAGAPFPPSCSPPSPAASSSFSSTCCVSDPTAALAPPACSTTSTLRSSSAASASASAWAASSPFCGYFAAAAGRQQDKSNSSSANIDTAGAANTAVFLRELRELGALPGCYLTCEILEHCAGGSLQRRLTLRQRQQQGEEGLWEQAPEGAAAGRQGGEQGAAAAAAPSRGSRGSQGSRAVRQLLLRQLTHTAGGPPVAAAAGTAAGGPATGLAAAAAAAAAATAAAKGRSLEAQAAPEPLPASLPSSPAAAAASFTLPADSSSPATQQTQAQARNQAVVAAAGPEGAVAAGGQLGGGSSGGGDEKAATAEVVAGSCSGGGGGGGRVYDGSEAVCVCGPEVLGDALEIAQALAHLHSLGLLHGRLQPSNVLLRDVGPSAAASHSGSAVLPSHLSALSQPQQQPLFSGRTYCCKVADFGLSKPGAQQQQQQQLAPPQHQGGVVDGAPAGRCAPAHCPYTAPELLEGRRCSPAADVFSYGALLWHMLTGHPPPPQQQQQRDLFQRELHAAPGARAAHPATLCGEALTGGAELLGIARACMARDPADRPALDSIVRQLLELVPEGDVEQ